MQRKKPIILKGLYFFFAITFQQLRQFFLCSLNKDFFKNI